MDDARWMLEARAMSKLATCDRKRVGAVIVRGAVVAGVGWNAAPDGLPQCDDAGHVMDDSHCVRVIPAETRALINAARSVEGATIYVTASPCLRCFHTVAAAGIKRIVYGEFYRDDRVFEAAKTLGIKMERFDG